MKQFNPDRVLWWRLILEEYVPYNDYITGKKNIAADVLSWLPNNKSQETTHESTYWTEIILELYGIKELIEGTFPLFLNL